MQVDRLTPLALLATVALGGCADDSQRGDPPSDGGIMTLGEDDGSVDRADIGDDSPPDLRLDLGGHDDAAAGDPAMVACDNVDLLFVIDNSGSMTDEQINLVNSFPAFIETIQTELANVEGYNIGVITTDVYDFADGCEEEGAMVTNTGGENSSNASCGPYVEGNRYMTEKDDLADTFACAAQVGTQGDGNERPMQSMLASLSSEMVGEGGCNEGFLRDDALLVVVIITDEEDDHEVPGCLQAQSGSSGGPKSWAEELIQRKGGIESNVVVLALVGPPGPTPVECPALDKCGGAIEGAEVAKRIVEFTSSFTHGFVGRVCEPSYASFFSEAVGVIEAACEHYQPVG